MLHGVHLLPRVRRAGARRPLLQLRRRAGPPTDARRGLACPLSAGATAIDLTRDDPIARLLSRRTGGPGSYGPAANVSPSRAGSSNTHTSAPCSGGFAISGTSTE